jgi:eukaryotic-like serine/threonine-protein kinase
MSPEACMGKTLTVQSDLYMLGTCLFIAITGKPPFRGSNSIQTASKHMIEPVPRLREVNPALEVGGKFEAFITKALAKDPDQRYASALEFKEAMLAASKH